MIGEEAVFGASLLRLPRQAMTNKRLQLWSAWQSVLYPLTENQLGSSDPPEGATHWTYCVLRALTLMSEKYKECCLLAQTSWVQSPVMARQGSSECDNSTLDFTDYSPNSSQKCTP